MVTGNLSNTKVLTLVSSIQVTWPMVEAGPCLSVTLAKSNCQTHLSTEPRGRNSIIAFCQTHLSIEPRGWNSIIAFCQTHLSIEPRGRNSIIAFCQTHLSIEPRGRNSISGFDSNTSLHIVHNSDWALCKQRPFVCCCTKSPVPLWLFQWSLTFQELISVWFLTHV